jgi:hypothetical protein
MTDTSLDFALDCQYLPTKEHHDLTALNTDVCRILGSMIFNPKPFLLA